MRFVQVVQQQAGVSRRKAAELIKSGRVVLNGVVNDQPFIELARDDIKELKVDGVQISLKKAELAVYKYYKPIGMISTHTDPNDTMTLGKVLDTHGLQGFAIAGRLDRLSEGLILFSNDGNLINLITHPRYRVEKKYEVIVPRVLPYRHANEMLKRMKKGINSSGERLRIKRGRVLEQGTNATHFELVLTEGKKHEVRRLFENFRMPVKRLIRTAIGPIKLGTMHPKELVRITGGERRALREIEDRFSDSNTSAE